MMLIIKLLSRM